MPSTTLFLTLTLFTLLILIIGVIAMAKGGKFNEKYSNKLMVARVAFQAIVILLVVVVFWLMKK
jgi:hypothetical protein